MKTTYGFLTVLVLLLVSCEDFLNRRPEATVPSIGIDYTKPENIFLSVSAAYASMRTGQAHAFPYVGAFEIASDNADKGSTPEDNPTMRELDNLTWQPNNTLLNDLWVGYFNIVSASNYAISQMPLFVQNLRNQNDITYAIQCQGEARFIRAYAYFNLTRLFGRVPIIDTVLSAQQLGGLSQSSTADLYTFIEKDLRDAVNVLPDNYTQEWAGRVTRFSAMALKAKVHLYRQQYDSVRVLTDKIIASGNFALLPNFRDVFKLSGENSQESLFEIQSSTLGQTTGDATYLEYAFVQGPRGNTPSNMQGWGFCTPSADLINFFTTRKDSVRAATTFLYRGTKTPEGDSIKMICTNPVYNGKVYTPSSQNRWNFNGYGFDQNVRVIRYPDVLLMFAEAAVRGSTVPVTSGYTALKAINEVRQRVRLPLLTSVTLQNVLDERRAELALEEDRYFDLVRTGQAASALASKGFVVGKHEVYPIPIAQMQVNPNLTQNPGY